MNKLNRLAISDEGFIFDPERGDSFTTNGTGLCILEHLKQDHSEEEIIQAISDRYGISKHEAEQDLSEFLRQLKSHNLWDQQDV